MNKSALFRKLIQQLADDVERLTQAAQATHEQATDAENKAEDKYDTRGLEASYLAHGQSKAAEEAAHALAQFRALPDRELTPGEPVALGALVAMENAGQSTYYFIGPRAGGTEILHEGQTVMVVTPASPLGHQLMGRREGDQLTLVLGGRKTSARLALVR